MIFLLASLCVRNQAELSASDIFKKVSPSIFTVSVGNSRGSGVVIEQKSIITNCHVVTKGLDIKVSHKQRKYNAELIYADIDTDLCQLHVPDLDAPVVDLGQLETVVVGSPAFTIGSPRGLDLTISEGIISSKREHGGNTVIQTTAAISKGSSGGGLFDAKGRLIGVTTFYVAKGQSLNFAMPSDLILKLPKTSLIEDKLSSKYFLKSHYYEAQKTFTLAEKNALNWVRDYPESWFAWLKLGGYQRKLNKHKESLLSFKEVIRINPLKTDVNLLIGITYQNLKQFENALIFYEKYDKINPGDLGLIILKAGCMLASEQFHKAIRFLENVSTENQQPPIRQLLGVAYSAVDKHKEAIYTLMPNTNHSKLGGEAWLKIGDAQRALGENIRAIRSYKNSLDMSPDQIEAWSGLAKTALELDDTEDIITSYSKVLEYDSTSSEALYGLGYGWYKKGSFNKAKKYLNSSILINSDSFDAWYLLGNLYAKKKSFDSAVNAFNRALDIEPNHAKCLYKLGLVYGYTLQKKDLRRIYRKLKSVSPKLAQKLKNKFRK